MARHVTGVIDDCVPATPLQAVESVVTVADDCFEVRKHLNVGATAIKERHIVPAAQSFSHHMGAEKSGAAKNKNIQWFGVFAVLICPCELRDAPNCCRSTQNSSLYKRSTATCHNSPSSGSRYR